MGTTTTSDLQATGGVPGNASDHTLTNLQATDGNRHNITTDEETSDGGGESSDPTYVPMMTEHFGQASTILA